MRRSVHRAPPTVIGYHGCSRATAERILGGKLFTPSTRRYDWQGVGICFWEYGPYRAQEWAAGKFGPDAAVLEATIRLGRCLNLLDVEHGGRIANAYESALLDVEQEGVAIPQNMGDGRHYRDRHKGQPRFLGRLQ
jgi:hypothetical protein